MRTVVQRVLEADIEVLENNELIHISHIDHGLVVLLGIAHDDGDADLHYIADKLANMRIFDDADGKINLSVKDAQGEILLIPQFTLFGDMRHGRRPSFSEAASSELASALYHDLADCLLDMGLHVKTGHFRTHMQVSLNNNGPMTILLDSRKQFGADVD